MENIKIEEQEILNGNIVIANWFKDINYIKGQTEFSYKADLSNYSLPLDKDILKKINTGIFGYMFNLKKLKFHSDSIWQWKCIEKISNETNKDINSIFKDLFTDSIYTQLDLFNSIVKYVKNLNDERNT